MWGQFVDIEKDYFYSCGPFTRAKKRRERPGKDTFIQGPENEIQESEDEYVDQGYLDQPSDCEPALAGNLPEDDLDSDNEDESDVELYSDESDDDEEGLSDEEHETNTRVTEETDDERSDQLNKKGSNFYSSIKKICWNSRSASGNLTRKRKNGQRRFTVVLPDRKEYHETHTSECLCKNENEKGFNTDCDDALCVEEKQLDDISMPPDDEVQESKLNEENDEVQCCMSPNTCMFSIVKEKSSNGIADGLCAHCVNQPRALKYELPVSDETDVNKNRLLLVSEAEVVCLLIALHPKAAGNETIAMKLRDQFVNASSERKEMLLQKLKPQVVVSGLRQIRNQ
mmetsp:Transcript_5106/g.5910  ORF Transcript_5106/g.5910 Transcript_5106/m.5910 type:complete len:341 (-) Transcript_5106:168-1190(-)